MRPQPNLDTKAGAHLDARAQAPFQQQPAHPSLVRVLRLVARQRPQPRVHLLLGRAPPLLPRLPCIAQASARPVANKQLRSGHRPVQLSTCSLSCDALPIY